MERLWALAERAGIRVRWADLGATPEGLRALYLWDPQAGSAVIVLDRRLAARPRELRCVLAEELGHHFTVPRSRALSGPWTYGEGVLQGRDEERAFRWAAAALAPDEQVAAALARGEGVAEMAERFGVTEAWMAARLRLYRLTAARRERQAGGC